MDAKLISAEYECYDKLYSHKSTKEETRDAVVPDTMPDIAEVLCCVGSLLIRSKDVSDGRVRLEANIPACVIYRSEEGGLDTVNVAVPVFFSLEDEAIKEGCPASAELKLIKLEARTLNPRKIMVKAEIGISLEVYSKGVLAVAERIAGDEPVHCRCEKHSLSLVTSVCEKSFALSDDLSLPPAAEGVQEIIIADTECCADDIKTVGSKIIVKGRIKSRLIMLTPAFELCHLEPITEFSQIIELGGECPEGLCSICLLPSGAYCQPVSPERDRLSLEYHIVAQVVYRSAVEISCLDRAYSNSFDIECVYTRRSVNRCVSLGTVRESSRCLFESEAKDVLYSFCTAGSAAINGEKAVVPLDVRVICSGGDRIWSEKHSTELSFRLPCGGEGLSLNNTEIKDFALLPVPGGVELRLEAAAELSCEEQKELQSISSVSYDEESPIDNTGKPSLVLVRIKEGDELWNLAKENCSSVEAIEAANGISGLTESVGRLILIPKTS